MYMYIVNSVDKANYLVFSIVICIIILALSPNEDLSNDFCSKTAKTFKSGWMDVARVCKRVMMKIRKKSEARTCYNATLGAGSFQLTTQRRPSILKVSSFSCCLSVEDGLLKPSLFGPDILWNILVSFTFLSSSSRKIPTFENKPAFSRPKP